ncbi:hypothetical protein K491DRAFT_781990 [Lophiostoma macrostomum CBS 122681]|uniref:Uncharacterized protein n=1 Tax=Lophiostoma macrostomum CBS 122681 TaxID=1314788 RepID=A0A6A6SUC7_9PLEO|nr:hypothetical protein K491DRAFT_781990 [Lophiostoma macrostomum CBS 122681]
MAAIANVAIAAPTANEGPSIAQREAEPQAGNRNGQHYAYRKREAEAEPQAGNPDRQSLKQQVTLGVMDSQGESKPFLPQTEFDVNPITQLRWRSFHRRFASPGKWFNFSSPAFVFLLTSLLWFGIGFTVDFYSFHQRPDRHETPLIKVSQSTNHGETSIEHLDHAHIRANVTEGSKLLVCGRSTAEAKEMGCTYDVLANNWVPTTCVDHDAIQEYQADGSWFPYLDEDRTQSLDVSALGDREFYYTSARDHIVHCAMLWKKQFRAFFYQREKLDTILTDSHHTFHCADYLINMTDWGTDFWNMPIKVFPGVSACWVRE